MNLVIIMGNLGKDPELRYTASGTAVANFSVAINSNYTDASGEKKEQTTWVNVVAWKKTAEACSEYLKKGSKVLVQGRLQVRSWEKDGTKHWATEVVGEHVKFLDGKKQESATEPQEVAPLPEEPPF